MDYGKYYFQKTKKKVATRKHQKRIQIKEIKFRPTTDIGDYNIKLKNLIRFLEEGHKTKVTLRFRGREMAHQDQGVKMMVRLKEDLAEYGVVDQEPALEGRQMIMVLSSRKKR